MEIDKMKINSIKKLIKEIKKEFVALTSSVIFCKKLLERPFAKNI
jgi:hypothetical protein